ncbi:MAG: zf-HC2 domain-containing protein [Candidatus Tectomicrobia bacterium]
MECHQAQRLLDAFVDGYTDGPTTLDLHEHLRQCAPCQDELALEHRLRDLLTTPGMWERAPTHLRQQIVSQLPGRPRVLRPITGVALVLLCLALTVGLLRSVQLTPPPLVQLLEAATETHQGLDNAVPSVHSTDLSRLRTALATRFPYRFGVPQPGHALRLLGGTPCTLHGVSCRAVLYERSGRRVSYFVFPYPRSTITAVPHSRIRNRTIYALRSGKYQVLFWPEGPVICALVADLAPHALLPLARSAIAAEAEGGVAG